jgi:hypothetical protein
MLDSEPSQATWKLVSRVVHLKYSPVGRPRGGLGSVQDRRGVQPNVSSHRDARPGPACADSGSDLIDRHTAEDVRAGSDQKGSVGFRNIIEVHPQSHHSRQQFKRRLDVMQLSLHGPRSETIDFQSLHDGDRSILMPGQGPVHRGCFVEQDRSNRSAVRPKGAHRDRAYRTVWREKRPSRLSTSNAQTRMVWRQMRERVSYIRQHRGGGALLSF